MKKGMFSMMNYYLPLKGIASMHCSANTDMNGENTAIFFGSVESVVLPVPERPKKIAVFSPFKSVFAEQCMEALPLSGRK